MIIFVLCIQKIKKILCLTSINPLKPQKKRFFKFVPKKIFFVRQSSDLYTSKNSSLQDKLESIKKKIITLRESIKKALMKRLLNIILNISPIRKIQEFVFGQFKSTYYDFGEIFFSRHFFTFF